MDHEEIGNVAVDYARRGWRVLPLHTPEGSRCTCGRVDCDSVGKHPRTLHGVKDATSEESSVRAWWNATPGANVGIATGTASGFVVLDIDPRHDGDESLHRLLMKYGELPETVQAITGGLGEHYLFAVDTALRSRIGLKPGIDLKADGGYIVAPPSLHPSGRRYEWEASSRPDDVGLAPLPDWIRDRMETVRRPSPQQSTLPCGERNMALASLAGTMRRRGMTEAAIRAALHAENEQRGAPPLPRAEVDRIAGSIAGYAPDVHAVAELGRPRIVVSGQQDGSLLSAAREALHRAGPDLYYHQHLCRLDGIELRPLRRGELHDRLARAANWRRLTRDGETNAPVPTRLTDALLDSPSGPIPEIEQVIPVPAFDRNFDLVTHPKLDGKTLFAGEALPISTPSDTPSPEDITRASQTLEAWLCEFRFADPVARAHALALLITLLTRAAVQGRTPLFLIEAATPGTGKTLLAEVVCLASHGRQPVSVSWTRDGEELGKRAASWVISGRGVVLLDDVSRIEGEGAHVLSSLVTTGSIEVRAMRELASAGGHWSGVIVATGNNVQLAEEMPRKVCRVRLESPEDPWTRSYDRLDLHAWTLEHRAEIIRAVAILVAAWKAAGQPNSINTRPSFSTWASSTGGILRGLSREIAAAFLDPRDVADMMSFDDDLAQLTTLVNSWSRAGDEGKPLSAGKVARIATEAGVLEEVMGDGSDRSRATRLGCYLKRQRGKVIRGLRIIGVPNTHSKTTGWSLRPVGEAK